MDFYLFSNIHVFTKPKRESDQILNITKSQTVMQKPNRKSLNFFRSNIKFCCALKESLKA